MEREEFIIEEATALFVKGETEEAIKTLQTVYGDDWGTIYTELGLICKKLECKLPENSSKKMEYSLSASLFLLDGAEKGNSEAQYWLAYEGIMSEDYDEAAEWITKSVAQNYKYAWGLMGKMYENGDGFKQNLQTAFECYKKGAQMEDPMAQVDLARCYYLGKGTEQNKALAKNWLDKASQQEFDEADKLLLEWFGKSKQTASSGGPISWVISVILIIGGIGAFSQYGFMVGVLWCLAGFILCPAFNKNMKKPVKVIIAILVMMISKVFL